MPLHYSWDGYTFRADAHKLAIEPGPKPITLTRRQNVVRFLEMGRELSPLFRPDLRPLISGEQILPQDAVYPPREIFTGRGDNRGFFSVRNQRLAALISKPRHGTRSRRRPKGLRDRTTPGG